MKISKIFAVDFFEKYPRLAERVNAFAEKQANTMTVQNIILCLAVTLANGFYFFEERMHYMDAMRVFMTVLMLFTWAMFAFVNGVKKRISFMIFFELYWLLPFIGIKAVEGMTLLNYNGILWNNSRICNFLVVSTTKGIADSFGMNAFMFALILILTLVGFYVMGRAVRNVYDERVKSAEKAEEPEDEKNSEKSETKSGISTDYYVEQFLSEDNGADNEQ